MPPPPPPREPNAVSAVESLKHKLRAKFGMPSMTVSAAKAADENTYVRHNSADEFEPEAEVGAGGSVAVSVAASKSSGHDHHHRSVAADSASSISNLYDDSGLREIEVRRQEILSRLFTVGQGAATQSVKSPMSSVLVPPENEHMAEPVYSAQMTDSARVHLQKPTYANPTEELERPDDPEGSSQSQPPDESTNTAATRYMDVTSAIEQLKQRKRESLRMLR